MAKFSRERFAARAHAAHRPTAESFAQQLMDGQRRPRMPGAVSRYWALHARKTEAARNIAKSPKVRPLGHGWDDTYQNYPDERVWSLHWGALAHESTEARRRDAVVRQSAEAANLPDYTDYDHLEYSDPGEAEEEDLDSHRFALGLMWLLEDEEGSDEL